MRVVEDGRRSGQSIEAGAGVNWHGFYVTWTLDQGLPGPGKPGADPRAAWAPRRCRTWAPNGVELQDRFESPRRDATWQTGQDASRCNAAECGFGYRDSVFKHAPAGTDGTTPWTRPKWRASAWPVRP